MNQRALALVSRISDSLIELQTVVDRTLTAWERAKQETDDLYLDSVAFNLHGFYTGLERIFELIATNIDQYKPQGENWHQELLRQMATDIKMVRPPVISQATIGLLDEYRGFRHVVRNVYTFNLLPERMQPLVDKLPEVLTLVTKEIEAFLTYLKTRC